MFLGAYVAVICTIRLAGIDGPCTVVTRIVLGKSSPCTTLATAVITTSSKR